MNVRRHTFALALAMCVATASSCSRSDNSGIVTSRDSVAPTDSLAVTDDTALIAVADASECAIALAAFSAVSNILMSGLAKPSSFEADRYVANLKLTGGVITSDIEDDYTAFVNGYGAAGAALATARQEGVETSKGVIAIDEATAILNDVAVTQAAKNIATFLANDCDVSK